ncbi:MAG TPA: hypothetical protein PLT22_04500 [Flexilinea sp.]|nr:hypothetical protein [Flexilinea sp.]
MVTIHFDLPDIIKGVKKTIFSIGFILFIVIFCAGFQAPEGSTEIESGTNEIPPVTKISWSADSENIFLIGSRIIKRYPVPELDPQSQFYAASADQFIQDYCPGENVIVTLKEDRQLLFYEAGSVKYQSGIKLNYPAMGADCSNDKEILVPSLDEIAVELYDISSGNLMKKLTGFQTAAPVYGATFSPDGKFILWHARASFRLQNIADESWGSPIEFQDFIDVYRLSPDSKELVVAAPSEDYSKNNLIFMDTQSGEELSRIEIGEQPIGAIAYHPNGKFLMAADSTSLYRIDLTDKKVTWKEQMVKSDQNVSDPIRIADISFSPDGKYLAVLQSDEQLSLFRIEEILQ